MSSRFPALFAALLVCPLQEDETSSTIEQEIAALIGKTNGLESLHLVYEVVVTDEEPVEQRVEFFYLAPDLGRVRRSLPQGTVDLWIAGDRSFTHLSSDDLDSWKRARYAEPSPAHLLLNDLFPDGDDTIEPGTVLLLGFSDEDLYSEIEASRMERRFVLGWLGEMLDDPSAVTVEEDALVWSGANQRLLVSRKTGILESGTATTDAGEVELRLLECRIDEELDRALVLPPKEASDAEDDYLLSSDDLLGAPRLAAYQRVQGLLDSERLSWDARARTNWEAVMEAVHRERLFPHYSDWLAGLEGHVDGFIEFARSAKEDGDELDDLLEELGTDLRAWLETSIAQAEAQYVEAHPDDGEGLYDEELYEIEDEVIERLWDELVRAPLLERLDEKFVEVMGR